MKTFKEYVTGTDFENLFDIDLLPNDHIRGRGILHIYKDNIGDNVLMRRFIIDAWMEYFRYYLVKKIDYQKSETDPIR
jgi:hypothetical protein